MNSACMCPPTRRVEIPAAWSSCSTALIKKRSGRVMSWDGALPSGMDSWSRVRKGQALGICTRLAEYQHPGTPLDAPRPRPRPRPRQYEYAALFCSSRTMPASTSSVPALVSYLQGMGRSYKEDDVGFIREVARHVQRDLPIPDGRTFALGYSFGGAMTLRLTCEASDTFDGFALFGVAYDATSTAGFFAPVGGKLSRWLGPCEADNSSIRRPFLQLSGSADRLYPSERARAQWRRYSQRVLGCSGGDNEVFRSSDLICTRYSQCDRVSARAASEHCTYMGMGHVWPGEEQSGAPGMHHLGADVAWEFWTMQVPPYHGIPLHTKDARNSTSDSAPRAHLYRPRHRRRQDPRRHRRARRP